MGAQTKYLAEWYRYFGGLADKVEGSVIPIDKPGMLNYTKYEPFGVVGLITPWNSLFFSLEVGPCARSRKHRSYKTKRIYVGFNS